MEYLKHKCNLLDYVHIYTPSIQDQLLHIYTYICTYIHANIHTYIHTYICMYVPANIRKDNPKRM